ncbi:DUF6443 domain-containing protein [Cellulophaga sp. Hel_I_12]|uniref:DUF6443 domain-containing protein n=1 Tax=Cellulophaga sp. Hel_I_12 TaxID=1249972 RepID=UPI000647B0F0|nr:DUF6443 domain-containing protein [Cellulophaga sp. Hel_I_12]
MDFKHLSKTLTFFFILFYISQSFAQFGGPGGGGSNFSLTGSSSVNVGESHQYNITGDTYNISSANFFSDAGVITSSTPVDCIVNFTTAGSGFVSSEVQDYLGSYYLVLKNVTVQAGLDPGSITGEDTICYSGDPNNLGNVTLASGGSGGYAYQWQWSSNGTSGFTNINGATGTSYNPPSGLTSTRYYQRRVVSGSITKYTDAVKITVNGLVSSAIGNDNDRCGSGSVSLTASPGNNANTIRWYSTPTGGAPLATGLTFNTPNISTTTTYYAESYNNIAYCAAPTRHAIQAIINNSTTYYADSDGDGYGNASISQISCTQPSNYVNNNLDCNDADANIHPNTIWFADNDGDGFGNASITQTSCTQPSNYVNNNLDCNDGDANINPNTIWYADTDGDGFGNASVTQTSCTLPPNYVGNNLDCNDGNSNINPNTIWYADSDGDGFGNASITQTSCTQPSNYVNNNLDCNDGNSNINPNTIWYADSDGDGFGNASITQTSCTQTSNYVNNNLDCNDGNSNINPNTIWYADSDGDGFGNASITQTSCTPPSNYVNNSLDCNDGNANINPNTIWYADTDGDGFGNSNSTTTSCTQPASYVSNGNDYDDSTTNITNIQPQYFYQDVDGDGFGDPANGVYYSVQPIGYVLNNTDNCPDEAGTYNGCDYTPPTFSNENYVYTRSYQRAMSTDTEIAQNRDIIESIAYFDGLGRPMQSVNIKVSPTKKDIITHIGYDAYGRQVKDYLPYQTTTGAVGSYRTDVVTATNTYYQANYGTDLNASYLNPFSEKEFEPSPLNRVTKQAAPGYDWRKGGGHEIEFEYQTNTFDPNNPTNSNNDNVRLYGVTTTFSNNTYSPTLTGGSTGYYEATELYKNITKDENHSGTTKNNTTEEFTDKQGRVVLKRTYADLPGAPQAAHDTYYVYDDFGNLTYVIPPKVNTADGISATELNELCYQYKYDHRNRLVEKKIPGKGTATNWEEILYNKLDQPILTRDPNLKAQGKWLFTKYDAFGRVAYTGLVSIPASTTRTTLQTAANAITTPNWVVQATSTTIIGGTPIYYNNGGYPTSGISEIHTINYYDTYVDTDGLSIPAVVQGQAKATNTKGLATVGKVRVLTTTDWITSITGYDQKGRSIYGASKNNYLNTNDIVETKLDFVGKVEQSKVTHTKGTNAPIITEDSFTYDHMGRLLKQEQTINSGAIEVIAENTYDDLGQLKQKQVGGTLQTVDYAYNIRGWLKQINNPASMGTDLFAFKINYNTMNHGATPLFNGNISETEWRTANTDNSLKWYKYGYDALNRITAATDNTTDQRYRVFGIEYDKNGNIGKLKRNGHRSDNPLAVATTDFGLMDDLVYTYYNGGNKLRIVDDRSTLDRFGFKDDIINGGSDSVPDYVYDANGNMTSDTNKEITTINYNHLNLPTQVSIDGGTISYIYDATGVKQKKTVSTGNTEYAGNYIYENGSLQFFSTPEGYVHVENGNYEYVYQYKDHLGNVRLSYSDANSNRVIETQSEIIEESNFYPFGLEHKGYNNVVNGVENNYYNYNGKELEKDLGINWIDYGWRNYDASLGRWFNIDNLSESMRISSPYNYALNNPVYYVDINGLFADPNDSQNFTDYYRRPDGSVWFDPDVDENTILPKGYTYIGPTYYDEESRIIWGEDGTPMRLNSIPLDEVTVTGKKKSKEQSTTTQDGLIILGDGLSGTSTTAGGGIVTGTDRGSHSIIAGSGDINPLNTILNEIASLFKSNEATMEVPSPEPDVDDTKYNVIIYYEKLKMFRVGMARRKVSTNYQRNDSLGASKVIESAQNGQLGLSGNAEIDSIRVVRPKE